MIDSGPSVEKAKPVESKEERRMRRDIKARRRASREAGRRSGAAEAGNDRPELQSGAVIRERPEVAMPLGVKRDHSGGLGRDAVGMESEERKRKKRRREKGLGV